ncbi:MAG: hypothetical protein K9H25_06120 [Rhodospirillum sp.]|nr:hypothetical protein [Rhodospirillum sp.]MCF8488990.1 hypothetical protein [Rhodospirillum sp.]
MHPRRFLAPLTAALLPTAPVTRALGQAWERKQPPTPRNDPKRPVTAISGNLGIAPDRFVTCFNHVNPTATGARPTGERVHANKAVLLPCLQIANPKITNEGLDAVMDRYRPGGHEAQRPLNQ